MSFYPLYFHNMNHSLRLLQLKFISDHHVQKHYFNCSVLFSKNLETLVTCKIKNGGILFQNFWKLLWSVFSWKPEIDGEMETRITISPARKRVNMASLEALDKRTIYWCSQDSWWRVKEKSTCKSMAVWRLLASNAEATESKYKKITDVLCFINDFHISLRIERHASLAINKLSIVIRRSQFPVGWAHDLNRAGNAWSHVACVVAWFRTLPGIRSSLKEIALYEQK